jgi:Serine proteases of the peptidase family S9A
MRRQGLLSAAALASLAIAACSPAEESDSVTDAAQPQAESATDSAVPEAGAALNAAIQAEDESLQWLEEVEGERALDFARAMNERSLERLQADPRYQELFDDALEILQSQDRIAYVGVRGGELWNFWRDAENTHGLWRRTTMESYATDSQRVGRGARSRRPGGGRRFNLGLAR